MLSMVNDSIGQFESSILFDNPYNYIMLIIISVILGLSIFDILNVYSNKNKLKSSKIEKNMQLILAIMVPSLSAIYNKLFFGNTWISVIVFIFSFIILISILSMLLKSTGNEPRSELSRYNSHSISYWIFGLSILGLIWLPVSSYMINESPMITSVISVPEKLQIYGQPVLFIANSEDKNNDQIYYRFLVNGQPAREWSKCNYWTWDTSEAKDIDGKGNYNIIIQIKDRGKYDNFIDDFREIDYTLASAEIEYPKENASFNEVQFVKGTSKGIGKNQKNMFWFFIKNSRTAYWPQDRLDLYLDSNGNWSTEVYVKGSTGQQAEILVALLNETASETVAKYYEKNKKIQFENNQIKNESKKRMVWSEFNSLPIGAQEMDFVKGIISKTSP